MTKIKNTKKGMAKKTLSMSLVVAMLATSNVPVWAAEFSDGSDADVAVTTEAPAVDTAEEFSDSTEVATTTEAPVVEDGTTATVAQTTGNYTAETNLTLKKVDWNTGFSLEAPDGEKEKFSIKDENGVDTAWSKIEVYVGDTLYQDKNGVEGIIKNSSNSTELSTLKSVIGGVVYGLDNYLQDRNVTLKVYAGSGSDEKCVYEFLSVIQPVNLNDTNLKVNIIENSKDYNGKVQNPTLDMGIYTKKAYWDWSVFPPFKYVTTYDKVTDGIFVQYENVPEAKNVGKYNYKIVGDESKGYTGTIPGDTFEIKQATPDASNLSVTISGSATYGTDIKSLVTITDKYTGDVISPDFYDVEGASVPGTYDTSDITDIKLKDATINGRTVKNNFKPGTVKPLLSDGNYAVTAFDLSKLGEKYTVNVATKKIITDVTANDITFTDKAGKTYKYAEVIPSSDVDIKTTNNSAPGEGTVTLTPKAGSESKVTGSFSTKFKVVQNLVEKSNVAFAAGTKYGKTEFKTSTSFTSKEGSAFINTGLAGIEYNGTAQEPLKEAFSNLVIYNQATTSDIKLTLGTDYDLIYSNNTDSDPVKGADKDNNKLAKVTFVFKGNYEGSFEYTFNIRKADATVTAKDVEYVNGKNSYGLDVSVTTADKKDIPASEYTVTTKTKGYKVGDIIKGVVVSNNKNYHIVDGNTDKDSGYDYKDVSAKVVGRNLKNCTAIIEGDYVYTGDNISPKLVVKDGDVVLVEGKDYKISSQNNINAGKALITLQGMGNYTGSLTVEYEIKKANLSNAKVTLTSKGEYSYTGIVVTPEITSVKIGNTTLRAYDPIKKTGDYTITYDEAVDAGTYNFTLTALDGSKNVEGEYKGTFKVTPRKLVACFAPKLAAKYTANSTPTLETEVTGAYYTGSAITIDSFKKKYVVVADGNKVLTEGKDYRLEYKNNINAGKASVVAYGIGNYATTTNGEPDVIASMNFYIGAKETLKATQVMKISDVEYAGGLPVEPEVVVYDKNKNRLVQGVDYTVETIKDKTPITKRGDYDGTNVIVKGKGAYVFGDKDNAGVRANSKLTWKVTKKDLKNTTITVDKNNNVTVLNGSVVVPASEYDVKFSNDGKKVTVTAKTNSENYTGSKELDVNVAKVGATMIEKVTVSGNKATVILSGEADDASGYDYVISTSKDPSDKEARIDVVKNQVQTLANFKYVPQGMYYAYCHAWTRDENGKKVFGEWSNVKSFTVTATTPEKPEILSVKRSGSTITVTYKESAYSEGYDVVLGNGSKKEHGETRPYQYGKYKKLNVKPGVCKAVFKNVPAGTYYAGVHSWNRSAEENNNKVFSKWSDLEKVTVK